MIFPQTLLTSLYPFVAALSLFFVLITASVSPAVSNAYEKHLEEYAIKAAFTYNFTKFVQWPSRTFPIKDQPFIIGIVGSEYLDEAFTVLKGKKTQGRTLKIKLLSNPEELMHCHVLFIANMKQQHIRPYLQVANDLPVLTIGQSDNFLADGGIIQMKIINNKIRFAINLDASKNAGLEISSKLLQLAIEIVSTKK